MNQTTDSRLYMLHNLVNECSILGRCTENLVFVLKGGSFYLGNYDKISFDISKISQNVH